MGIDIGGIGEMVLVQSPPSIAAAVQRIGRAGHRVGESSRGALFPTHVKDFLEAAVLAKAADHINLPSGDLEPGTYREFALCSTSDSAKNAAQRALPAL